MNIRGGIAMAGVCDFPVRLDFPNTSQCANARRFVHVRVTDYGPDIYHLFSPRVMSEFTRA